MQTHTETETMPEPTEVVIWKLLESDVQEIANQKLGRELTPDELDSTRKGIEYGLGEYWGDIVEAALPYQPF
jgi:hypothetical protein